MSLTEAQHVFFDTFGYLRFEGLMSDSIADITAAYEAVWDRQGGGHHGQIHDGSKRSCIVPFIDKHERLCRLLDDQRILDIVEPLLGKDFNYCTSDGNYYSGNTNWHSHPFFGGRRALKVAFYLDTLTRDTGCLRVVPGSHKFGDAYSDALHAGANDTQQFWGIRPEEVPSVALETKPGDILVFNHCVKHGSFGGGARRRLFVINFSEHFPEEDIPHLKTMIGSVARFWADQFYGPIMVDTADARRMTHLRQVLANQAHLPALAAKARAESVEPSRG